MPEPPDHLRVPRLFASARIHLNRALEHQRECIRLWDEIRHRGPFAAWPETSSEDTVEIWCAYRPTALQSRTIDEAAGALLAEVKSAMDAAVLAAAIANVGLGTLVVDKHSMPLCFDASEFDELPYEGWLMGLRPDQVNVVRDVQPFAKDQYLGVHMRQFALALRRAQSGGRLISVWAGRADPRPNLPEGYTLTAVTLDEPGTLEDPKRLATLKVSPRLPDVMFTGNPNIYFDPILNVAPWPVDSDDNLDRRTDALLTIVRTFIEILEDSLNTDESIRKLEALDASMPSEPTEVWVPVRFDDPSQEQESRQAIQDSDRGQAIYSTDDGLLTYLALRDGRIVGREIPDAEALPPGEEYGTQVERATRAVAGRWGLPDFVLRPKVVPKGSGRREIGDGTIVSGFRGIALQVKARSSATPDTPERARSWLLKNAGVGLRQARGTIRSTFRAGDVTLDNLRGRPVRLDGKRVEWVAVVVLDHPNPPREVVPPKDADGPSVVMLRRDWEFLWNQLRSASAVVDYIHRVSGEDDPAELGSETNRYFDLANKDLHVLPSRLPDWMNDGGADPVNVPLLPTDPTSASDELGFRVFQRILEDIAGTDFTGDETDRVQILSHIDRVAVATRAELGRLLLRRLITCGNAPPGTLRVEHRLLYVDQGELHLSFTCMGTLTGYYQEMFRSWLLHRRQRFLAKSNALGPMWPWSVGVLLTPRPSTNGRLWDTTMIATNGPPEFDNAEYRRLDAIYASVAPDRNVEDLQAE
ncbi:hypothetical protein OHA70_15565 [Kribbella sp. NBC_00382]|uniref:hypothetical protein n=1 Tax=Kribbella sp. NBC_00382 TaxID=2975967 RepID=UPI002E1BC7E5